MTTNAADPVKLIGFAQSLDGIAAAAATARHRAAWTFARYQRDCADVPVVDHAIARSGDALDHVRRLSSGTRHVAAAFETADRARGAGRVRFADDAAFSAALATMVLRAGGVDPSDGIVAHLDTSWSLDAAGIEANLEAAAFVGIRREGSTELQVGPVTIRNETTVSAGAGAEGDASLTITRDGAALHADAEAFAGVKVETRHTIDVGPCTLAVDGTASAGAGAEGSVDAEVSRDEIAFSAQLAAALAVGGGGALSLSCSPPDLTSANRWLHDRFEDGLELRHDAADALEEGIDAARATPGKAVDAVVDAGGRVIEAGETVRNWFG